MGNGLRINSHKLFSLVTCKYADGRQCKVTVVSNWYHKLVDENLVQDITLNKCSSSFPSCLVIVRCSVE